MNTIRVTATLLVIALCSVRSGAQQPRPPQPPTPRASAPIDLTGVWVSIVDEDWRWRMVTAAKGDYPGIALTPAGFAAADAWDPATDGSCRAFGAAGLLRMPTRVRVSWRDDLTLKLETDNGQQTRLLHFGPTSAPAARSLQGHSVAAWRRTLPPSNPAGIAGPPGFGPPSGGGHLEVTTTNLAGGWLRRNGVPYGAKASMTEYFDRFPGPDGAEWFVVTTAVTDPEYLIGRSITSSHFRREPDASKWSPRPCKPI